MYKFGLKERLSELFFWCIVFLNDSLIYIDKIFVNKVLFHL